MKRVRLDTLLSDRGLFSSRSRAAASVLAGDVVFLPERRRAEKPGQLVSEDVEVEVASPPPFVSRGGIKLANAARRLGYRCRRPRRSGRWRLDRGLHRLPAPARGGPGHVVDVAYGELDWRLRSDQRVTVIERMNARSLRPEDLPYAPDLIAIDVSFISLAKILPAVLGCAAGRFDCLALVKPQFEVGRDAVGKGGVVRDPELRRAALIDVGRAAQGIGAAVLGYASSGLPGPKGNRESFVWLAESARRGVQDLDQATRTAEP